MTRHKYARGFTLLEVLITLIILAIGLLGLANLQSKVNLTELESYQRGQAVLLLKDMADRIATHQAPTAGNYVTDVDEPLGVDNNDYPNACSDYAIGVEQDKCYWSKALQGASETKGTTNVGAMLGARGCVELVQNWDDTTGVCDAAVFRVSIAWQGLHPTAAPALTCAETPASNWGGDDRYRRLVTTQVTIPTRSCTCGVGDCE